MKSKLICFIWIVLLLLSGCSNRFEYYKKIHTEMSVEETKNVFLSDEELFVAVADSIIKDSTCNVYRITPYIQEVPHSIFQRSAYSSELYWISYSKEVSFDDSYAKQTSDLFTNTGLLDIEIDYEQKCIIFCLCADLGTTRYIVYTDSGSDLEGRSIVRDDTIDSNWYIGHEED